jgi:penicillin-binding protein 1C
LKSLSKFIWLLRGKLQNWSLFTIGCVCILFLATLIWIFRVDKYAGPSFNDVRTRYSCSESQLLDRHGAVLHEQRTNDKGRWLEWVRLQDISPALIAAILSAEDQRFYHHHGVDWPALIRASLRFGSGNRGASTISMQLAARLNAELHPARQRRTISQKWLQIKMALSLERSWSKAQILEAYLNQVTFRGELRGLTAAAGGLFNKKAHGFTQVESVILAALVRAPNADPSQVIRRACVLSDSMKLGLAHSEIAARAGETLNRPYYIRPSSTLAYHVMQRLFREARNRGMVPSSIVCTLDRDLQQFALDTLCRHIQSLRSQNVHDGAVLVLDNRTGDVLAYIGNIGDGSSARYVDGVQALRQAGSTLKPFIYGAAFDQRILTAATKIDDSPIDIPATGGLYRPENYDQQFHGPVSVRTALASSLNIPAVKVLNLTGVDSALRILSDAGFDSLESAEFYGLSLALGAAEVRLWALTNAYRCLANEGKWQPIRLTFDKDLCESHHVLSPQTAFILSDILSDRESRSQTFSLESPLSTRFWTAVKTGTSKDMRDNWCIGFSGRYTVGVWTGNFSGESMWNVSGISGAAPVWVEIMNWLHRNSSSYEPKPPAGVVTANNLDASGRREWFIKGTENSLAAGIAKPASRIVYPAANTIIALDPDIPSEDQKLFFEAGHNSDNLQWKLDGREIGNARELCLWIPVPGKHALTLVDAEDRIVDSVAFEVRGR